MNTQLINCILVKNIKNYSIFYVLHLRKILNKLLLSHAMMHNILLKICLVRGLLGHTIFNLAFFGHSFN